MQLLHPEVDIEPGRPGARPMNAAQYETQPLAGSAILRLTNGTTQNNTYKIALRSDNRFWQPTWYTITSQPPEREENMPPAGHPDERGPQDRWLKVYVSRDRTRDILIRFNLPRQPDSRAGRYAYQIEVETQVIGGQGDRRRSHIQVLNAEAIVRPYYKWGMDLSPEKQMVGRRRRGADYELIVTNEGNDWLYCDVQLPRPTNTLLDAPTLRVAVPPPEPGELLPTGNGLDNLLGTQRKVPIRAVTRLKAWRGVPIAEQLQVAAQRMDAPGVPLAADNPNYQGIDYVLANVVQGDTKSVSGNPILEYHPPIPASVPQLFTRLGSMVRASTMTVLGLFVLIPMISLAYQGWRHSVSINPREYTWQPGRETKINGKWLLGATLTLKGKKKNGQDFEQSVHCTTTKEEHLSSDVCVIKVDSEWAGAEGKASAHRGALFVPPFLSAFFLKSPEVPFHVEGGQPVTAPEPATASVDDAQIPAGETLQISTHNVAPDGNVLIRYLGKSYNQSYRLNGNENNGNENKIAVKVPSGIPPQTQLKVIVQPKGKEEIPAGSVTVVPIEIVKKVPIVKTPVVIRPPKPAATPPVLKPLPPVNNNLAQAYDALLVDDWTHAQAEADKAPDVNQNPMAIAIKGYARARQADAEQGEARQAILKEAEGLLSKAETLNQGQAKPERSLILAAQAYILLQKQPNADDIETQLLAKFKDARTANEDLVVQYLIAAECFLQVRDEDAVTLNLQFIMERNQALTNFKLAQFYEQQKNYAEAEKYIKKAEDLGSAQKISPLWKQTFRKEHQQIQLNMSPDS